MNKNNVVAGSNSWRSKITGERYSRSNKNIGSAKIERYLKIKASNYISESSDDNFCRNNRMFLGTRRQRKTGQTGDRVQREGGRRPDGSNGGLQQCLQETEMVGAGWMALAALRDKTSMV